MARPKPIVLFSADLGPNGVSRNTVNVANALVRRGLRVEVICLAGGQFQTELEGAKLTLLGRKAKWRPAALTLALPALRRRLRVLRPAIVLSMGNHAHLALWAALRGQPQTPRVYRISNDLQHQGEAGPGQSLRRIGLQLIAADADRLLCVSEPLALHPDLIAARRQGRVAIVENGVDLDVVRRNGAHAPAHPWALEGKPYIVAVGRIHAQKNYGTLIEALSLARAQGADLRLMILGGGAERATEKLRAKARAFELEDFVDFCGPVANPLPLVKAAAAYVLPSLWEGASNSLLEAVACGAPIVASRSAGNARKVLGDGRYGLLVSPTDAAAMAQAILQQANPQTRVLPQSRAEDFDLDKTMDAAAAILMGLYPSWTSSETEAAPLSA